MQTAIRCLLVLGWLVTTDAAVAATPPVKIYVETDLEGASGVFQFSQCRNDTPATAQGWSRKAMEFLMGDIAAVVRGLRDGGADEVIVVDGHGHRAFLPELMAPGAKYVTGTWGPEVFIGLDKSCSGVVMLAFHAMMGTPDGVLCHTQNSVTENRYWYNGVESGELVQTAAVAGHFGVPPIMVTGDEATCREAKTFFGEHCVVVPVKKGLAREGAMLYPFEETRQSLYEGAKRAMAAIPNCKPYTLKLPIQAKMQYLVFEGDEKKPRLVTKEGTIPDALHLFDF